MPVGCTIMVVVTIVVIVGHVVAVGFPGVSNGGVVVSVATVVPVMTGVNSDCRVPVTTVGAK